jgi:hypothetical protein
VPGSIPIDHQDWRIAVKIALIALIGVAAGLLGGGASVLLFAPGPAPDARPGAPDAELARLDQVDAALARIEERLHRLEVAPPMAAAPTAVAIPGTPMEEAATPAAAIADVPADQLEDKIRDVVAEREQAQREEWTKRRSESEAARQAELMEKLTELGLNSYQQEQLAAILEKRRESMNKFRQAMFSRDEGVDRSALRDEMHTVRQETDTEIQELLTTDQYAAFQEMDSGGRGSGRGRGGSGR